MGEQPLSERMRSFTNADVWADEVAQLEAENERLRELMSKAVLDDWFIQQEPDFEKRWNRALKEPADEELHHQK